MQEPIVLHVVPNGNCWAVKRSGNGRADRLVRTRDVAYGHAEQIASREAPARIVLHAKDGSVESQTDFEGVPAPDVMAILTSPPVLSGIAGALIVSATAGLFAWRR